VRRGVWLALLLVAAAALAGCRSPAQPIGVPLRDRTRWDAEWRSYQRFDEPKALAVAGDIQGQFVTGIASGMATQEGAGKAAMEECAQRRADRRLTDECRIYAIGNDVVTR
jgi:hypothetical protein